MMILFLSSFFLLHTFLEVNCNEPLLIDQLRYDFLALENNLWGFVLNGSNEVLNNTDEPGIYLLKKFYEFDQEIQQMPEDILYGLQVVQQTRPFLFLFSDLRVIHDLYDKFRRIQSTILNNQDNAKNGYQQELAISHIIDDILYDPKNNVNKTILAIFERMFVGKETVITELFQIIADNDYDCKNNNQPMQQVLYNLYNILGLVELKGYMMMQYSYLAGRLEEKGNHTNSSLLANKQYEARVRDNLSILRGLIQIGSAKLWRCDPQKHIKGVTYEELTGLIQGHIENEVDMNYRGTCKENCQAYSLTRSYGCYDSESQYCRGRKSCSGNLFSCRFIESHMTACIAPSGSPRRYDFIKYDSGRVLGKESRCYKRTINSWHRWFVHCSYCFCLCDQQGLSSDRYFNLRPVMADVTNNRVVTGLRIIKHNRIIHLQIQEGKLLPYGYIDNSTVRWVPVDDYKITDSGIRNGEDFHTMNFEKRTLYLDDLKPLEADHVVTGVRFEFIDKHLRFEINVRGFNFKNGTLSKDSYYIYGTQRRSKINLDNSDIPTYSPPSRPNWSSEEYIEFTHSSIDKDAAQTTVPFFDTQPVATYPAVPLRGAGIYFKGRPGYGGFVAPEITIYDFNTHLQEIKFPQMAIRKESSKESDVSFEEEDLLIN